MGTTLWHRGGILLGETTLVDVKSLILGILGKILFLGQEEPFVEQELVLGFLGILFNFLGKTFFGEQEEGFTFGFNFLRILFLGQEEPFVEQEEGFTFFIIISFLCFWGKFF